MSKNLILILALLVIIGGGWWYLNNSGGVNPLPTGEMEVDETTGTDDAMMEDDSVMVEDDAMEKDDAMMMEEGTVQYTASGFTPTTITVEVGTTVTWVNESKSSLWVMSDPHPSHEDLPGLDSEGDLLEGESYSYTFNEVGTWGYHNESIPIDRGTVVVE